MPWIAPVRKHLGSGEEIGTHQHASHLPVSNARHKIHRSFTLTSSLIHVHFPCCVSPQTWGKAYRGRKWSSARRTTNLNPETCASLGKRQEPRTVCYALHCTITPQTRWLLPISQDGAHSVFAPKEASWDPGYSDMMKPTHCQSIRCFSACYGTADVMLNYLASDVSATVNLKIPPKRTYSFPSLRDWNFLLSLAGNLTGKWFMKHGLDKRRGGGHSAIWTSFSSRWETRRHG